MDDGCKWESDYYKTIVTGEIFFLVVRQNANISYESERHHEQDRCHNHIIVFWLLNDKIVLGVGIIIM